MKTLYKYISLLIIGGLILPFCSSGIKIFSSSVPLQTQPQQVVSEYQNSFSVYPTVIENLFPVPKNQNSL
ncbi:hypothetical protein DYU05_12075 [Mucilaginibacter terrenus]|uniref:Uncharacterized protein n=1 Tax=Mucilaginibacter terrenus TaxID=2482727 RepID=A0A3E2NPS4_9SPHI|nr:hypothetical protein [Mucilaginibacter terrenus]RFZ82890.1 hypothetical protein DYU05_12075 [Mucilaginibacter terrenus]